MTKEICTCLILFAWPFHVSATDFQQFSKRKNVLLNANWISPTYNESGLISACPIFIKNFKSVDYIKSAKLYITALGLYDIRLNGKKVGNAYFTPGYTSYEWRSQYQQYDVTDLLKLQAKSQISVTVADGWYRGAFGADLRRNNYGKTVSLLLRLDIEYTNGKKETIVSDKSWQVTYGSVVRSGIYEGELVDTRPHDALMIPVAEVDFDKSNLIESIAEPVSKHERFVAKKVISTPKGEQVMDFGQNIAGWVQFTINGKSGDTIRIAHAEALDHDGNFYTGNLRLAAAVDTFILKGGQQTLEPHFTYHGFRYAKVEGTKITAATKKNWRAIVLYSDLKKTGTFSCSSPDLNQLQSNIKWSLNSNFFDIPTDCPQRSERFGWTGDAQVFFNTACYLRYTKNFFTKWLADMAVEQGDNGGFAAIVPRLGRNNTSGIAGWGDAATIIPWNLFSVYNDTTLLEQHYPMMRKWVDYITSKTSNDLWYAGGYGDWYAPGEKTPLPFIDQCFYVYSTRLLMQAAVVLKKNADVSKYQELYKRILAAFQSEYAQIPNTQTAYVLALQFDLLDEAVRKDAAARLVELIHQNNDHLATGFLGTPYLLPVLSRFGYPDVAYTLLMQKTIPSWLYPITKGATTIWEKWDAIKPDGSFDTCSLNHYAYGAVGEWLYTNIAGIQSMSPGYKTIRIAPVCGGGLSWAKGSYISSYGKIVSDWKIQNGRFYLHVEVPRHTNATVVLPDKKTIQVSAGSHDFSCVYFKQSAR